MSENGTPAFPGKKEVRNSVGVVVRDEYAPGMTLRDYFAGQALVGLLSRQHTDAEGWDDFAGGAYELADAMLKARGS